MLRAEGAAAGKETAMVTKVQKQSQKATKSNKIDLKNS